MFRIPRVHVNEFDPSSSVVGVYVMIGGDEGPDWLLDALPETPKALRTLADAIEAAQAELAEKLAAASGRV